MKKINVIIIGVCISFFGFSQGLTLKNNLDSVAYSIGVNLGTQFMQQGLENVDPLVLTMGINDILKHRELLIDRNLSVSIINDYLAKVKEEQSKKMEAKAGENKKVGEEFLAKNKLNKDVVTTASGLQYKIITKGNGMKPVPGDTVKVHYHGYLIDGRVFDSSVQRGEPIEFPVTGVIQGWVEALQLMPVGSKWTLYIPSELAYGSRSMPGSIIEPNSVLIFDVELLDIPNKKGATQPQPAAKSTGKSK
ncbi:MAG: FKBP-type peptidyl-prolyl cis-trans isomerase [Bacteroidales bacterium]